MLTVEAAGQAGRDPGLVLGGAVLSCKVKQKTHLLDFRHKVTSQLNNNVELTSQERSVFLICCYVTNYLKM